MYTLVLVQPAQPLPAQLRHAYAVCADAKRLAALRVLLRATAEPAGSAFASDLIAPAAGRACRFASGQPALRGKVQPPSPEYVSTL